MKLLKYTNLIIFTVILNKAYAVDYSKCMDFINPDTNYGGVDGSRYGFGMMPYVPFELLNDGKIKPHKDVLSYKYDKERMQEIIDYEMPTYDYVSPEDYNTSNPYKQRMRKITVTIQRDDSGNIIEIKNDQNISQADIDKQIKVQKAFYDQSTPESVKKQQQEWAQQTGQKFQLPFYSHSSTSIKFEIKNGQCVPTESSNTALIEPKKDGQTFETTNYNINLCKDIDNFLEKNPEAASCFKKGLNDQISSIFNKYLDQNAQFPNQGYGFGMGGGYGFPAGGFYSGYGAYGFGSLEQQINHGKFWGGNEKQTESFRKGTGTSPVITGHMILQNCYNQGLGIFIDDPSIWQKAGIENTGNAKSEENSTEK